MTANDLRAWQQRLGYTYDTAAEELGMHRATYARYLKNEGELPRWLAWACAAISEGLVPFGETASTTSTETPFKPRLNRRRTNAAEK